MNNKKIWSRSEVQMAYYLYCQLPFGRLHKRTPEIIELAALLGRSASSIAMKLANLASLDIAITETGRKGLSNTSELDRQVWSEFHTGWQKSIEETIQFQQKIIKDSAKKLESINSLLMIENLEIDYTGENRTVITQQRKNQQFFRNSVLSGYRKRCCMSGLSEEKLLIASHIVPWSKDLKNRLNPSNGLCLSAIHDRAFDQYLISIDRNYCVLIGSRLKEQENNDFIKKTFLSLEGKQIELPEKFLPRENFLVIHNNMFNEENMKYNEI